MYNIYRSPLHLKYGVFNTTRCFGDSLYILYLGTTLRHKPEGRGFDPRLCHWHFSLT
jgi:hypothetical protein